MEERSVRFRLRNKVLLRSAGSGDHLDQLPGTPIIPGPVEAGEASRHPQRGSGGAFSSSESSEASGQTRRTRRKTVGGHDFAQPWHPVTSEVGLASDGSMAIDSSYVAVDPQGCSQRTVIQAHPSAWLAFPSFGGFAHGSDDKVVAGAATGPWAKPLVLPWSTGEVAASRNPPTLSLSHKRWPGPVPPLQPCGVPDGSQFNNNENEVDDDEEEGVDFGSIREGHGRPMQICAYDSHFVGRGVEGHVLALALDRQGCRVVQRILELLDGSRQVAMVAELRGHVWEALESMHGNHVLQRCVELLRPSAVSFILTELKERCSPTELARHRYGCRVVERLIEHFPSSVLDDFLSSLFDEALELSTHVYGNFVVQHVLEHGSKANRRQLADFFVVHASQIAKNPHGCCVLDKALSYCAQEDRVRVARALLYPAPGHTAVLLKMASQREAFAATCRLFRVIQGSDLEQAKRLLQSSDGLLRTKHGKALLQTLAPEATASSEFLHRLHSGGHSGHSTERGSGHMGARQAPYLLDDGASSRARKVPLLASSSTLAASSFRQPAVPTGAAGRGRRTSWNAAPST